MRILFAGDNKRAELCLEALLKKRWNIIGTILNSYSTPDNRVRHLALSHSIPVFQFRNINRSSARGALADLKPDLLVLCGYNQILKSKVISMPGQGAINLHGGKLPQYRGSSVLNWALINGEKEAGVSIIFVDEGIDTGDVIAQKIFPIALDNTIHDLYEKTYEIFPPLLNEVLDQIQNKSVRRIQQDESQACYYHKRHPADGLINWNNMSASQVYDLVRALTRPCPGAFTYYEGKKLILWKASLLNETVRGIPGRICFNRGTSSVVIARDKGLLLDIVQLEGENENTASKILKKKGTNLGLNSAQ